MTMPKSTGGSPATSRYKRVTMVFGNGQIAPAKVVAEARHRSRYTERAAARNVGEMDI